MAKHKTHTAKKLLKLSRAMLKSIRRGQETHLDFLSHYYPNGIPDDIKQTHILHVLAQANDFPSWQVFMEVHSCAKLPPIKGIAEFEGGIETPYEFHCVYASKVAHFFGKEDVDFYKKRPCVVEVKDLPHGYVQICLGFVDKWNVGAFAPESKVLSTIWFDYAYFVLKDTSEIMRGLYKIDENHAFQLWVRWQTSYPFSAYNLERRFNKKPHAERTPCPAPRVGSGK